jgi:hypothetical protein
MHQLAATITGAIAATNLSSASHLSVSETALDFCPL